MVGNLRDLLPAVFTGPNGQPLTPDQVRARQAIAASLLERATDTSPTAGGWASVLSKGVQGFASGYKNRSAERGSEAATKADSDLSSALLGSLGGGSAPTVPMTDANAQVAATSPSALPSGDNADYIRNGLISRGFSPQVSDAFLANFQDESGLNPGINEQNPVVAGSRGGYGLYQLTGPRRVAYENFAKERGVDPSNIDAQLDFLKYEVNGPEAAAAKTFMDAPDTATAAQAIVNNFLRPAPQYRQERAARYASLPSVQTAPVSTVEVASIAPVTATDASPIGQGQTVADPTVATPQNISPVAQALTAPVKGDRLGATTMQNFNDRFGSAVPVSDIPEIYSQPQDFPAPQQAPVQATPQPAPVAAVPSLPAIQPPPALPPAVIQALSSPYASESTKRVAYSLLQQNQEQKQAYQEQVLKRQATQQALQQRQSVAQSLGINPQLAADDDAWKQAVSAASGGAKFINAGDGNIYNSQTGEWIQRPNSGQPKFRQATTEEIQRYGVNGQVDQDGKFYPITPPRGTSITLGNDGSLQFNEGAGVTQRAPTEAQAKDAFFTTRMTAASPTLDKFEQTLLSPDQVAADYVPGGRYYQSEEYQLARDAGDDFVASYLRKDSGAALTKEERSEYGRMLLPQPGDKPAVIDAKRQRRQIAIQAIKSGLPPSSVDSVLKAIQAVPGADKAAMTTEEKNIIQTDIPGVTIRRKN